MNRLKTFLLLSLLFAACPPPFQEATSPLWRVYENALKEAKYVDLTHTITPSIPVWSGFGGATFGPAVDPNTGIPYTWAKDGAPRPQPGQFTLREAAIELGLVAGEQFDLWVRPEKMIGPR